ncbi:hypothetical protein PIIN_10284 [Serendipita indica DSM 11827]|uniref:Uncharacterized protein n=1 Tax=Serendipita indica (strain DSM 11827) TaxID=1109443 RepID=G4TY96_SERID|nr:hypothetical protein PIIN_10284 [Serendipita indica DSM 11827]
MGSRICMCHVPVIYVDDQQPGRVASLLRSRTNGREPIATQKGCKVCKDHESAMVVETCLYQIPADSRNPRGPSSLHV